LIKNYKNVYILSGEVRMENKKYIFLSYSRVDTKFAKQVARDLRAQGFEVWMDQSHISGGKHWDKTIEEALSNASSVILIISKSSVESENVKDEVSFAKNRNLQIIPILYQDAETPLGWSRLHWIDMHKDYAQGLEELIASIRREPFEASEKKLRKGFYKSLKGLLALLTLLVLAIVYYIFFRQETPTEVQKPSLQLQSVSVKKDNLIIIGNDNQDINISQE